jgi:ATP-independent RNA helicase DbpA
MLRNGSATAPEATDVRPGPRRTSSTRCLDPPRNRYLFQHRVGRAACAGAGTAHLIVTPYEQEKLKNWPAATVQWAGLRTLPA